MGLSWVALLTNKFDLADYGVYAMGMSAATLIAGVLDNPFYVRVARLSDEDALRDQSARAALGLAMALIGALCLPSNLVPGIALGVCGSEMALGAIKSTARRSGDVAREQHLDIARQGASIICGTVALLCGAPFTAVIAAYLLGYGPFAVQAFLRYARRLRGPIPPIREFLSLGMTAGLAAAYAQLDVLVLGWFASSAVAGSYAIASLVAWGLASVGQQFTNAQVAEVRVTGHVAIGRLVRPALGLGAALGCAGIAAYATGLGPASVCASMIVLAPFVTLRTLNWGYSLELMFRGSDGFRMLATAVVLVVNVTSLLALITLHHETLAGPLSSVIAEIALIALFVQHISTMKDPRLENRDSNRRVRAWQRGR